MKNSEFPSQPSTCSPTSLASLWPLGHDHPSIPHPGWALAIFPFLEYLCLWASRNFPGLKHFFPSSWCGHSSSASRFLPQALPTHPFPMSSLPKIRFSPFLMYSWHHGWSGLAASPAASLRTVSLSFLLTAATHCLEEGGPGLSQALNKYLFQQRMNE